MTNDKHLTPANKAQLTERVIDYNLVAKPISGRNTLCTEDNIEIIISAVKDGLSYKDAAGLAGISEDTLYNWQRLAKRAQLMESQGKELSYNDIAYLRFYNQLNKAKVEQKLDALQKIKRAGTDPKHWHANAWLLERKYPDEFGRRNRVEIHDWRKDARERKIDTDMILAEIAAKLESKLLEGAEDAEFKDK